MNLLYHITIIKPNSDIKQREHEYENNHHFDINKRKKHSFGNSQHIESYARYA